MFNFRLEKLLISNICWANNFECKKEKINSNNLEINRKKEEFGLNKIIKKRIILEEEYMISPQGEKKLLSVKRLERKNNNDSNSNIFKKDFKNWKKINNFKSSKNRLSWNSSLFTSIFKDNTRPNEYNKIHLKSIDEDSQILSNSSKNYNSISKLNDNNSKNITEKIISIPSHKKKRIKNNISSHFFINSKNIISNKSNKIHQQNINSDFNHKQIQFKKKLFYSKMHLIKNKQVHSFNKNNYYFPKNNARIGIHTDFLITSRDSANYVKDKQQLKKVKGIYKKIAFYKERPLLIFHNENQSNNYIINNKENCQNLLNIMFYNQDNKIINERKKKYINL